MSEALETWREKLADFQQQEAIAVAPDHKFQLKKLIAEAKAKIAKLEEIGESQSPAFHSDISRIVKYAPAELIGRESETAVLNDAWAKVQSHEAKRPHILTFVALGGEGKTSLVAKWAADLAHQDWPGCDAVFAWSFYSQGTREQNAASSDLFLAEALSFFGDAAMAGSAAGAFDKGRRLAQLVGEWRALLILDGLEPLQYPPGPPMDGKLKDDGIAELLKGLAATSKGLCVVTTRYAIPDLRAFLGKTVREEKLTRLSTEAGVALLQALGVNGSLRKTIPAEKPLWNEYEKLVEDVKGHALTLNLLGTYLRDAHAGDIRQRDLIKLEEADAEEQGGHAFRVMDAYVQSFESGGQSGEKAAEDQAKGERALALLQLLGLFDRLATADCLKALWQLPAIAGLTEPLIGISEAQRNLSLKRLEDAKLLMVNRANGSGELIAFDAHPLLREYFARRVRQQQPEVWRAAHRRLYEHLCETTPDKPQPALEDLQPLYQAVFHGCQAGLQQDAREKVYRDRILRGTGSDGFYSTRKLGAFGSDLGAVACFFETRWSSVSSALTEVDQAWLLNLAAFRLRALGRLNEALETWRTALKMRIQKNEWKAAAIVAGNLSEVELTMGKVVEAVNDTERSVTYADRSRDTDERIKQRGKQANAKHQVGHRTEAEARFQEAEHMLAERMQADNQPSYSLLYCVMGFQYCDLLLAEAERAAWQWGNAKSEAQKAKLIEAIRVVSQRATQTLQWAESWQTDSFSVPLDRLTLGRAALYAVILESANSQLLTASSHLAAAITGLRSGDIEFFVNGLLTRSWLRSLIGARTGPESAQSDLDEAWEIAERGPMKLFLADIHLYRARLFFREQSYPWISPQEDLAAAEKLINDCGYHRRDGELADAKQAILGQGLE